MALPPIGVRIRNSNLITVIDDRYFNLMLRQKIVGLGPTYNPANREYHCVVTITCSRDALLAYRVNGGWAGITNYVLQSETSRTIDMTSYSGFSLDIYVFDLPEFALIKGGIGFIVRNRTTGKKVFDSRGRYMKILGYLDVNVLPNSGNYNIFTGFDKLPAVVPVQPYLYDWAGTFDTGSGSVAESGGDSMQTIVSGNNIFAKIEEWRYKTGGGTGGSYGNLSGSKLLMFLDVTGY